MSDQNEKLGRRDLMKAGVIAAASGILTTSSSKPSLAQSSSKSPTPTLNSKLFDQLPTAENLTSSQDLLLQLENNFSFKAPPVDNAKLASDTEKQDALKNLPDITRPIDTGAEKLLGPFINARLRYPPLQIEYLVDTLSEHINTCLEIREKAQELETQAILSRLDLVLDEEWHSITKASAEFNNNNANRVLGNKVDPKYDMASNSITGKGLDDDFFKTQKTLDQASNDAVGNDINRRKTYYTLDGSGINYTQRFEFLKELFENELKEAYQRALSVSAGLYYAYGLKFSVPEIKDVGYLSDLAVWTRKITYALEQKLLLRTKTTLAFALRSRDDIQPTIINDTDFKTQRSARRFVFDLKDAAFSHPTIDVKKPLLRGMSLAVENTRDAASVHKYHPIRFKISLEEQEVFNTADLKVFDHDPVLRLSSVTQFDGGSSGILNQRELHNVKPVGRWEIEIDTRSILGRELTTNEDEIGNIILFLHVSHEI